MNQDPPVILLFDRTFRPINNIPFPVVTICPTVKTSANKFNYTDMYHSLMKLDGNGPHTIHPDE